MKLQRTTWILLVLALILGGFVYFYEIQGAPKREAIQAKQKQIFDFEKEEIKEITIEKKEETLEFERTGDENKLWQMKQPEDVPASDAAVSFLLNLLVEGKSDRSFTIPSEQSKEYGFDKPFATVEIQLENQETHKLILGKPDFKDQFLYAQADPPSQTEQELTIILVPKDFQYAVERELEEWKQKEETPEESDSETEEKE
ncbi:MAG: DUF4340 domain-containing protein [Xenococcaceae cyanobacterium]